MGAQDWTQSWGVVRDGHTAAGGRRCDAGREVGGWLGPDAEQPGAVVWDQMQSGGSARQCGSHNAVWSYPLPCAGGGSGPDAERWQCSAGWWVEAMATVCRLSPLLLGVGDGVVVYSKYSLRTYVCI